MKTKFYSAHVCGHYFYANWGPGFLYLFNTDVADAEHICNLKLCAYIRTTEQNLHTSLSAILKNVRLRNILRQSVLSII